MNILYLCNEYPPGPSTGGIGIFTQAIASRLKDLGHTVVVAGFYKENVSISSVTVEDGVRVYRLKQSSGFMGEIRSRYRLYRLVKRIIREDKIEILEAPDYLGLTAGWLFLPIPVIIRLHGSVSFFSFEMKQALSRKYFWFERAALKGADNIVSVSNYAAEVTRQVFKLDGPFETIYNFVTAPEVGEGRGLHRDPLKVVFTGTLIQKKGVFSLIDAWPAVLKAVPLAQLHFYGKDTLNEDNISVKTCLLNRLPPLLRASILFHGHIGHNQLQEQLRTASVAVFPSFSESFGLAPIEAMTQACPTIYTRLASGPEIIHSCDEGILIDPACPQEIADAIIMLLKEPVIAERIGKNGRKAVSERFAKDKILERNILMYAKYLKK